MRFSANDLAARLPLPATPKWPPGVFDIEGLTHGTMSLLYFAPRGRDHQTAHKKDELNSVISGSGVLDIEGRGVTIPNEELAERRPLDSPISHLCASARSVPSRAHDTLSSSSGADLPLPIELSLQVDTRLACAFVDVQCKPRPGPLAVLTNHAFRVYTLARSVPSRACN
jgi:hypothetical protein